MGGSTGLDSEKTVREMDRLRADLERLKGDLHALSGDIAGVMRNGADHAKDFARNSAESTLHKLRKSKEIVEGSVAEHPLLSISLAIAAGMAAGALMMRKESKCD